MCVLKIYSDSHSFAAFADTTSIPIYSTWEKGDVRRRSTGEAHTSHRISFDVSGRDWDDFPGQVTDAIAFLQRWESELTQLMSTHSVTDAYLDFPIFSRLDGNIVNQNDHLPRELVALAGRIGLGIELAMYAKDAFSGLEGEA